MYADKIRHWNPITELKKKSVLIFFPNLFSNQVFPKVIKNKQNFRTAIFFLNNNPQFCRFWEKFWNTAIQTIGGYYARGKGF